MPAAINPPPRYLLGPGPAPVEPSVLAAMARPLLGGEDPELHRVLREVAEGLRSAFRSAHPLTLALAGNRATAVDAGLAAVVQEGTPVVVGVAGTGGEALAEAAGRLGGRVTRVEAPPGRAVDPEDLSRAIRAGTVVTVCHVEPSTGVRHPVEAIRKAIGPEPLLVVDASHSLAGIPLEVSAWGLDVAMAVAEHCVGAPPGLALLTASPRAEAARPAPPPRSLDPVLLRRPWAGEAPGSHSVPVTLLYALHEALRLLDREGLEARWKRHADVGRFLQDSLADLGFQPVAEEPHRTPHLTVVRLPDGVDDGVREVLLHDYDIEVGGGEGELAGETWRIGLMGFGARREHALRLLQALRALFSLPGGPGRARRP